LSRKDEVARRLALEKLESGMLLSAIRRRFPDLTSEQSEELQSLLISELSRGISQGKEVALARLDDNGQLELTIFYLDDVVEEMYERMMNRRRSG
jgi:hypothetical protein